MGINCAIFCFGCDNRKLFLGSLFDNFNMPHLVQESWSWSRVYKGFSPDSNPALTKERKAPWHQFSLGNKLRHRRALHDFFLGTLERDWTPGHLIPPTPTWTLQAFLFPVKWGQAFPGCSWQERSCDPGSQLRVQVRSFWAVSVLTPVQWILANEKKASTSAFSLPYPILFEQSSPCPTPG